MSLQIIINLSLDYQTKGGGGGLAAPSSFTWSSTAADTTPNFSMAIPGAIAGDRIQVEDSVHNAGSFSLYFDHTLTAPEIVAQAATIDGLTPWAEDSYDARARVVRGAVNSDWTSLVLVTINLAPTISALSPTDGASGVDPDASFTATFNKSIQFGTGVIELRKSSDDSLIESFDVVTEVGSGAGQVQIAGAVLTINPTASLSSSTGYYIKIDPTAIQNLNGIAFAGIIDTTTWNFSSLGLGGQYIVNGVFYTQGSSPRQYVVNGVFLTEVAF